MLGIVGGLFQAACYVPYIRDTLRGEAKPQRATWLIWSVLGWILLAGQLAKGATDAIWLVVASTIGVTIVFALSIKRGEGGFAVWDFIALAFAAAGLVAWYFTQEAAIAIYIAVLVDAIGGSLTVAKAYADPASETRTIWVLSAIGSACATLAVGRFDIALLAYPVYMVGINAAVLTAMQLGERRHTKS